MFQFKDADGAAMAFVGPLTPIVLIGIEFPAAVRGPYWWQSGWPADITHDGKTWLANNPVLTFDMPNAEQTITDAQWGIDVHDPEAVWQRRARQFTGFTFASVWIKAWSNGKFSANAMHRASGWLNEATRAGDAETTHLEFGSEVVSRSREIGLLISRESIRNEFDPDDESLEFSDKTLQLGWGSRDGSRR